MYIYWWARTRLWDLGDQVWALAWRLQEPSGRAPLGAWWPVIP